VLVYAQVMAANLTAAACSARRENTRTWFQMTHVLGVRRDQTHQWVQQVYSIARSALLRTTAPKQVVRSVLKIQHPHQHRRTYPTVHASWETKADGDKLALLAR